MDSLISFIVKGSICLYIVPINILRSCNAQEDFRNNSQSYIVKLRGLPWSATVEDIVNFFDDCNIKNGTQGIHLIKTKEGRPSGVAYVELESAEDMDLAFKKNHEYLGERFIEVFRTSFAEMRRTVRRSAQSVHRALTDACVRIRGLPFKTSEHDVLNFFEGLDILPNGITLVYNDEGRTTGEAYVQFKDPETAEKALQRDLGRFHHRYIEVFRSSLGELRLAQLKQYYTNPPRQMPFRYTQDQAQQPVNNYRGYQILRPLRFSGYPDRYSGQEQIRDGYPRHNQHSARKQEPERERLQQNKSFALHMRGLPFNATKEDIIEFFSPLVPAEIDIHYSSKGRATGQAEVVFKTQEDFHEAMTRDKSYMKHRYIELYE